jgi:5-methylthioribose kinase
MPTKKRGTTKGKTRGNRNNSNNSSKTENMESFQREIVSHFLILLNTVKLYHWKTHSYATHKATDELYSNLNETIDKFVEVLLGKTGNRIHMRDIKTLPLLDYTSVFDFKKKIEDCKDYLISLNKNTTMQTMSNTDLYNIRDELLGHLNQFLYLLTFQ